MAHLGRGHHGADRARLFNIFADFPRQSAVFAPELQIAARHVEADGVAPDIVVGIGGADVGAGLADDGREFAFPLIVDGLGRILDIGDAVGFATDGVRRGLGENEGRHVGGDAHFFFVIVVVEAHAENAAHGDALVAAGNSEGGNVPAGDSQFHGVTPACVEQVRYATGNCVTRACIP